MGNDISKKQTNMTVAIIGARGQLGRELVKVFGPGCLSLDIEDVDIREPVGLRRVLEKCCPSVLINTAAYHDVPECEKDPGRAFAVNAVGVKNLRDICLALDLALVQISTDYVFDGRKNVPYTEEDTPNPLNTYGVSKLAGEFFARQVPVHYVVRLAGLFGVAGSVAKGGTNFVKLMLEAARTKRPGGRVVEHLFQPDLCSGRGRPDPRDHRGGLSARCLSRRERWGLQLA